LYILDFGGYKIKHKDFKFHAGAVNDITIDRSGEYIATCSNDGKLTTVNHLTITKEK